MRETIYFDAGFHLVGGHMFSMIVHGDREILYSTGFGESSTQAEWVSAVTVVQYAIAQGLTDVVLIGDNRNVIDGMLGLKKAHGVQAVLKTRLDSLCQRCKPDWDWTDSKSNPAGEAIRRKGDLRLVQNAIAWLG